MHLRQMFLNIYGNCIKYNKVGGKVHTNCDCLGVHDNIVTYRWTIQDTGIGMSDEFIQHIFEPFAQERIDARSVYNGTGLGMSIVKSLIGKMGGTIEVTSKQGEGTQFVITLSFEISEEEPKRKLADSTVSIEDTDMGELHLLIVEDNDLNAEIAQTCQKFRSLP
ncbi:MAG: ATP-binding protein [Lachnospiraceae bacterium]|nr:ATP-binding protein [Lachnospiraceae bacterium]